jgi:hypothetical protein
MAGQARDLRVITGCGSPAIITARACPAPTRLLAQALSWCRRRRIWCQPSGRRQQNRRRPLRPCARHRTAVGRVACPRRVRAVSASATQQVEHNQPDSHQGKEDEQVPDDFHRRFQHPRKRLGECARQRRLGVIGKATGRGGAMRSTNSAPLGWGLGSSPASAAVTSSSTTRTLACRPATGHTHSAGDAQAGRLHQPPAMKHRVD